jgi:RNase P/RNase MRP subunit POP5|tara:strand:- start:116 stop:394 length:279 start_codon:yes stop_codon:yes gene_type:complete
MIKRRLKLKPSSRDKRRYFLVGASNSKIEAAILEYIGVLGFSKSAYMPVSTKNFPGKTVGSCLTKNLNDIRAALTMARIRIEKVSGTLKGLS